MYKHDMISGTVTCCYCKNRVSFQNPIKKGTDRLEDSGVSFLDISMVCPNCKKQLTIKTGIQDGKIVGFFQKKQKKEVQLCNLKLTENSVRTYQYLVACRHGCGIEKQSFLSDKLYHVGERIPFDILGAYWTVDKVYHEVINEHKCEKRTAFGRILFPINLQKTKTKKERCKKSLLFCYLTIIREHIMT